MKKVLRGLESLRNFLDTPEGEQSIRDFIAKNKASEDRFNKYVQKLVDLYNRSQEEFFQLLEKVINKYESPKYFQKELRLGREPREKLYDYFQEAFKILGETTYEEPYVCMFNDEAYLLGDYCARTLVGQGTVIQIQPKFWFKPHAEEDL